MKATPQLEAAAGAPAKRLDRPAQAAREGILRHGSWKKPEIRLIHQDGVLAVQKDYRRSSILLRPWFRWAWRHEEQIYRVLQGAGNSPRLMRSDAGLLVLQYVEGEPISRLDGSERGPEAVRALEHSVRDLHQKGIYHLDLRKRDNVLVTSEGQVHLLDFGSAVMLHPRGRLRRLLGPLLAFFDRYAVLKWKSWLDPAALTPSERRLLRRLDRLRGRRGRVSRLPGG